MLPRSTSASVSSARSRSGGSPFAVGVPLVPPAAVLLGLDPLRRGNPRRCPCGSTARARVHALRVLAAGHLQPVLRAGELHVLHAARRARASARRRGRRTGSPSRAAPASSSRRPRGRAGTAGPAATRSARPTPRAWRGSSPRCRRSERRDARRRIDAEVRVRVDDPGRQRTCPVPSTTSASAGIGTFAPTATIFPSRTTMVPFGIVGPAAVISVTFRIANGSRPAPRRCSGTGRRWAARRRRVPAERRASTTSRRRSAGPPAWRPARPGHPSGEGRIGRRAAMAPPASVNDKRKVTDLDTGALLWWPPPARITWAWAATV